MTVLDRVVAELRTVQGPIRIDELARRLSVQPSALRGMIDVLVAKQVVTVPATTGTEAAFACGSSCGSSCTGLEACAFVAHVGFARPVVIARLGGFD